MTSLDLQALLPDLIAVSQRAGDAILEVYGQNFSVTHKADDSPLTQADLASHVIIRDTLAELTPDVPLLSEESADIDFQTRSGWRQYWLVDPLDGTKEFVNRNGEFTVNIALIDDNKAVFGVVYVPVKETTYLGCEGYGAERRNADGSVDSIRISAASANPVRVVGSRSHRGASLDAYLENLGECDMLAMGSSLKFCVIAEGGADLYPRLGLTSEWDTAAAQAVVEQAGGSVVTLDGKPMKYNTKSDILNPFFFVIGATDRDWLALLPDSE